MALRRVFWFLGDRCLYCGGELEACSSKVSYCLECHKKQLF